MFWTLRNQKIKVGPRKLFSDGFGLGQQAKVCKELQTRPKRSFGPRRFLEAADRARNYKMDRLGINVIDEAQSIIYFTSVVKLGKPKTSGPIFYAL